MQKATRCYARSHLMVLVGLRPVFFDMDTPFPFVVRFTHRKLPT